MTIKVGVIGAGGIAQLAHLPSYHKIMDVEIVGIADVNEKLAKSASQKYHCKYYGNFKQLIDKNELDAVSICTPPFARNEIIEYAAENNINILCEKPMANSLSNALQIKRVVEKSGIQFMMGFCLRFSEWYQQAFEYMREGKLGEVIFSNCVYASPLPPYAWFFDKERSGGGVIIDRGSHILDVVTWFFGMPKSIYATTLNKRNMEVEENGFVTLTHEDVVSQLAISFGVNKPMDRVAVCGTACNLIIDHELNSFFFLPAYKNILKDCLFQLPKNALNLYLSAKGIIKKKDDMYSKEISYFVDCLKEGKEVSPNYLDGVNNIRIIDGCYKSIESGGVVEI